MANPNHFIHSSCKASKPSYGMDLLWPHHRLTQRLSFLNASEPASSRAQIQVPFPFQVFFFGLCVMLVLLCKIKDNLTRNLRKKKIIKKIEVNFLLLVEQKVRAIFVLFCFRNKLSWKSFLYGVFWNLMVLFLKF